MTLEIQVPSLYEAARKMRVSFQGEAQPRDREVVVGGLKIHYLEWGDPAGKPMVFLHGNSQQSHSWDFVSLAMCDAYRVIVPDARGHGDSDWAPDGDYSLDGLLGDMVGFADALGLERFILVGHSMGGRTSYVYTSQYPEKVKALVIVDTGPRASRGEVSRMDRFKQLPDQLDSYEAFVERVQDYTGRPRQQVLVSLKHSIRELPSGKWTWKYDKLLRTPGVAPRPWPLERLWECVAKIGSPTLIVRGADSDVFAAETMDRMLETIPNCTAVTVARAGHLVAGDNPADLVREMRDWLERVA